MAAPYVLRANVGVTFAKIAPAGFRILAALDSVPALLQRDVFLTCGTEGHPVADPHSSGEAYDVSVRGWTGAEIVQALGHLRTTLGPLFTVLYECPRAPLDPMLKDIAYINAAATAPHFHLQRKKGTVYP